MALACLAVLRLMSVRASARALTHSWLMSVRASARALTHSVSVGLIDHGRRERVRPWSRCRVADDVAFRHLTAGAAEPARTVSMAAATSLRCSACTFSEAARRVVEQKRGGWRGRWHAQNWCGNALDSALVGQGVAARPGQLAVGEGQLAGFGQRDERDTPESHLAAASADDDPLDPASGALGLDVEEQAIPVGVSSWRRGADEGGREGLVGVPASGLGSAGCSADLGYSIHPVSYTGMERISRDLSTLNRIHDE